MHWSLNKPVTVTGNGAKVEQWYNVTTGYNNWRLWNRARYFRSWI